MPNAGVIAYQRNDNLIGRITSSGYFSDKSIKELTSEEQKILNELLDINKKHGIEGLILGFFDQIIGPVGIYIPPNQEISEGIYELIQRSIDEGTTENPFALYDFNNECLSSYVFDAINTTNKEGYKTRGGKNRYSIIMNTNIIQEEIQNNKYLKEYFKNTKNPFKEFMAYTKEKMNEVSSDYKKIFEQKEYIDSTILRDILN